MSEKKSTKMHELLAIGKRLKGQSNTIRLELINTFTKKEERFRGQRKTFLSNEENAAVEVTAETDIQSTVHDEVKFFGDIFIKAINANYGIDLGNTIAKADIVLDNGQVLFREVPATALLELEKRFNEVSDFIKSIKTLDPVKGFKIDETRGNHIYVAREIVKDRTSKVEEFVTIAPATDKHPAQVVKVTKDKVVGKINEMEWSALITPAKKADLLTRIEDVLRAIISAKSHANETAIEIDKTDIASPLWKYVFSPLDTDGK